MQRERHGWAGLLGLELLRTGGENQKESQEMSAHLEEPREGNSTKIQAVKTSGVRSCHGGKAGEHEVLQGPKRITWPARKLGV